MFRRTWSTVAILAAFATVGMIGGTVAISMRDPEPVVHPVPYSKDDAPPPPAFNRWIDPSSGRFQVPEFDDRELSAEVKAKYPLVDPRWKPLSECLAVAGFETRAAAAPGFVQTDLDRLLASINTATDPAANKRVNQGDTLPGLPGAFLQCADQWLAIPVSDFPRHGWVIEFPEIPKPD